MNWLHPEHLIEPLREASRDWSFPADSIYLNHGSFGPPPRPVRELRQRWIERLDEQPMRVYVKELEPAWLAARERLSHLLGAQPNDLVFVENATYAMNVVAASVKLEPGDEVLLNNHEYGAVKRIWQRACDRAGAKLVEAYVPMRVSQKSDIIDPIVAAMNDKTKIVIVSHITSATAITFPVQEIVSEAHRRGILVCIDGPHAVAQLEVDLDAIGADYYCASCHKWLCAPMGSGFLHVHRSRQSSIEPVLLSWGRLLPALPEQWDEQFRWTGTRDYSPYLALPAAIDYLESFGIERFREATHSMARVVRRELESLLQHPALVPDDIAWYGCMTEVFLPEGNWSELQQSLIHEEGIEVPIISFDGRWAIRVSCHLYTRPVHVERLLRALRRELERRTRFV